jgi:hypothetical protein
MRLEVAAPGSYWDNISNKATHFPVYHSFAEGYNTETVYDLSCCMYH